MSGTMQDLCTSVYTSDGKIMQIEYAQKCVDKSSTIVGVVCKDGIILGAEKIVKSMLLCKGTDQRLYNVDSHIGMAIGGKIPDSRNVMLRGREEAKGYRKQFDVDISGKVLSGRLAQFVHQFTLYWSYRPWGVSTIIASHDSKGFNLHMIKPSGECYGYYSCTSGKGRQTVRAELDKRDFKTLTCQESLFLVSKMLHLCHDNESDNKYEIDLSWITEGTNFEHKKVPANLQEEASKEAKASIEQDEMGSDGDDDDE